MQLENIKIALENKNAELKARIERYLSEYLTDCLTAVENSESFVRQVQTAAEYAMYVRFVKMIEDGFTIEDLKKKQEQNLLLILRNSQANSTCPATNVKNHYKYLGEKAAYMFLSDLIK